MSKTSKTPFKKNNVKETCEQCGKKKRNQCHMQPQLTVWITASKQFYLESSLECQQRWRRCDSGRQTVPYTCCSHRKSAVTNSGQTRGRHVERVCQRPLKAACYQQSASKQTVSRRAYFRQQVQTCKRRGVTQASGATVTFLGQGPSPLISNNVI